MINLSDRTEFVPCSYCSDVHLISCVEIYCKFKVPMVYSMFGYTSNYLTCRNVDTNATTTVVLNNTMDKQTSFCTNSLFDCVMSEVNV